MAEEKQELQNSEGQVDQSAQEGKEADAPKNTEEVKRLELTQDELDEIIAKRVARERKKLDKYADYDEIKQKAQEYEAQLEKKEAIIREKAIRHTFDRVAQNEGIAYLDDAWKLADTSAVEYGEDGVKGVEEVVKSLVEGKPFLLKREIQEPKQIGSPSNPAKDSAAKTKEQLLEEARKKARSGRPEDMAEYSRLKRELGV